MADTPRKVRLIGVPLDAGAGRGGCRMGPAALRIAGIADALTALGHTITDAGDLAPASVDGLNLAGSARDAARVAGWIRGLADAAGAALDEGATPVFLGGDHALAAGSVSGVARHFAKVGTPLIVVWLDAHSDFNTPLTSPSGNMHGMPVAFFCGEPGFDGILTADRPLVPHAQVHQFGIRSIDPDEREALRARGINVVDMRMIDEFGAAPLMREILEAADKLDAAIHVSLDVDFLDPDIAPGVGTTVPGGASLREAHLVMEMLSDCERVASLDLVELNPYLDDRGKSARLLVDLTASLFGKRVFDRATRPATA